MEDELCKAAMTGDIYRMQEILDQDELILEKILSGSFKRNPLHLAISRNQVKFVKELLRSNRDLAEVLESGRSPLHVAAAKGNIEIVQALIDANRNMCFARDLNGRNPVHVAAIEGKVEVLGKLVKESPEAALVKLDHEGTILHLCVKHRQEPALKLLLKKDSLSELPNAGDSSGNTILHLAVLGRHLIARLYEPSEAEHEYIKLKGLTETHHGTHLMLKHLINMEQSSEAVPSYISNLDVNAVNTQGHTTLDMAISMGNDLQIKLLLSIKCKTAKSMNPNWLLGQRETLMVVASLIATVAFQAILSPPGGVWQDDSDGHRAGEAVMAYKYPDSFPYFVGVNTIGLATSLSSIFLLAISDVPSTNRLSMWLVVLIMWLTITSTMVTYGFSILTITQKKNRGPLTISIVTGLSAWVGAMALLLMYHTYKVIKGGITARKSIKFVRETKRVIKLSHIFSRNAKEIPEHLASHNNESQDQEIQMASEHVV